MNGRRGPTRIIRSASRAVGESFRRLGSTVLTLGRTFLTLGRIFRSLGRTFRSLGRTFRMLGRTFRRLGSTFLTLGGVFRRLGRTFRGLRSTIGMGGITFCKGHRIRNKCGACGSAKAPPRRTGCFLGRSKSNSGSTHAVPGDSHYGQVFPNDEGFEAICARRPEFEVFGGIPMWSAWH